MCIERQHFYRHNAGDVCAPAAAAAIAELKKFYTGPLTVGADLQCTQVQ